MSSYCHPLEPRRLLASIAMDLNFGNSGVADVQASGMLEVLASGKILAFGNEGVKRLNADGSIDTAFVDKGANTPDTIGFTAVIAGNRILVGGHAGQLNQSLFVRAIRLDTGDVDTSFGTNGVFVFTPQPIQSNPKSLNNNLTSLVATPDGGVLLGVSQYLEIPVANNIYGDPDYGDIIYKIAANGKFDTTFGSNGALIINNSENDEVWPHLAMLPGGKFLVLGETSSWSSSVWRYNSNGTLDTAFGNAGRAPLDNYTSVFPGFDAIFVQPDGKILLPFDDNPDLGPSPHFLARLNADGTKDTSFADNGLLHLGVNRAGDIEIDAQGRIVASGSRLFRLTPDGNPDPTFDGDGFVATTGYGPLELDAAGGFIVGSAESVSRFAAGSPVQLAPNGILQIDGDEGADTISATVSGDTITVVRNGQGSTFSAAAVQGVDVTGFVGNDVLDIFIDVGVTVHGGVGNDSIRTGGGHDSIYADDGADTVDAGAGNDVVFGDTGGDSLYGNGGKDIIFGGRGSDSLAGGDGNDKLYGGSETPTIPGDGNHEGDNDSLSGNAGNDRCDGMEGNDRVAGNGGRDRLFGGSEDDRIYGGASGDWLYGAHGSDQLFGEGGVDRLYADDAEPPNPYVPNPGIDTLHGNAGDDILVSRDSHVDHLFGDGGRDSGYADEEDELTSIEVSL